MYIKQLDQINKQNWTPELLSWLAGLIEGEGYIAKSKAFLRIRMTDWDIVQRCHDLFKIGNLRGPVEGTSKHKPIYEWTISKKQHFYELLIVLYSKFGFRRKKRIRDCFSKLGLAIPDQDHQSENSIEPPIFVCRKRLKKAS